MPSELLRGLEALRGLVTIRPAALLIYFSSISQSTLWQGDIHTEHGRAILTSTPPGDLGLAGIITRNKYGHCGLSSSNGAELTLFEFVDRGDDSSAGKTTRSSRLVRGCKTS